MIKAIKFGLLAALALMLADGSAYAGRGRGGGGGGGGGGGSHGGGAGSFHGGGGSFGGAGFSGGGYHGSGSFDRGGSISRPAGGSIPSFNVPHTGTRLPSGTSLTPRSNVISNFPHTTPWSGAGIHTGPHPGPGPNWNHHDWYHGNWHGNWNRPWHYYPYGWGWFGAGVGWGVAVSAPWSWGYWAYDNPYYVTPVVVGGSTIDYSQPIMATGQYDDNASDSSADDEAAPILDAARDAFAQGDYPQALSLVDKAIVKNPNDSASHEFRGLVCFASKKYKDAASTVYAVLSMGPGWDWTTLIGFYTDADVYTQQLRALEQYVAANPSAADARFLLAYHYLTCGYSDAAAKQLKEVVRLTPKDRLSAQLLTSLTTPEGTEPPKAPAPAAPIKPVDAASLLGVWNAQQPDGSSVSLQLTGDSKYSWKFTRQGKTQEHSGSYAVADNLLILKQGDTPAMVGQVASSGANSFNFKLANSGPGDPGLTFSK